MISQNLPFGAEIPINAWLQFGDRLEHYLKCDTWQKGIGVYLLAGVLPEPHMLLGSKVFYRLDGPLICSDEEIERFSQSVEDIWHLFESNPAHGEFASPTYWLEWAEEKRISIPWLNWAKHRGLLPAKAGNETTEQRYKRIAETVNQAHALGKSKKSAYEELAKIEGCGVENIKRIYNAAKGRPT